MLHPCWLGLLPCWFGLHPCRFGLHPCWLGLHPCWLGLHPCWLGLHPCWLGLHPCWLGLHPLFVGLHPLFVGCTPCLRAACTPCLWVAHPVCDLHPLLVGLCPFFVWLERLSVAVHSPLFVGVHSPLFSPLCCMHPCLCCMHLFVGLHARLILLGCVHPCLLGCMHPCVLGFMHPCLFVLHPCLFGLHACLFGLCACLFGLHHVCFDAPLFVALHAFLLRCTLVCWAARMFVWLHPCLFGSARLFGCTFCCSVGTPCLWGCYLLFVGCGAAPLLVGLNGGTVVPGLHGGTVVCVFARWHPCLWGCTRVYGREITLKSSIFKQKLNFKLLPKSWKLSFFGRGLVAGWGCRWGGGANGGGGGGGVLWVGDPTRVESLVFHSKNLPLISCLDLKISHKFQQQNRQCEFLEKNFQQKMTFQLFEFVGCTLFLISENNPAENKSASPGTLPSVFSNWSFAEDTRDPANVRLQERTNPTPPLPPSQKCGKPQSRRVFARTRSCQLLDK